jgi:citrate synthase
MVRVTAAAAVFAAAWCRVRAGRSPLAPDPERGHAADYLRMATGAPRSRRTAWKAYLVTAAEHGMNASTFAARVVASTGSDLVSAIVAGIGALKGPLHGGAPGLVLDMLDAIGEPERAAAWVGGGAGRGPEAHGHGPPDLSRARPARGRARKSGRGARARGRCPGAACAWPAPRRGRAGGAWRHGTRNGRCARTSSSTPRSCWRR